MGDSNFPFIENKILRQNLDEAFEHVLTLLPFTELKEYDKIAKSAFRKTIIIYTASIVEALLFDLLCNKFADDDISSYYSSWVLTEKVVLHKFSNEDEEIVSGKYKKQPSKRTKEKMNLGQIVNFLKEKGGLPSSIVDKIDNLRKLRNEQHIGTHKQVKSYTKKDLETSFEAARVVKDFVKNNLVE